jgi:hypothetical protein
MGYSFTPATGTIGTGVTGGSRFGSSMDASTGFWFILVQLVHKQLASNSMAPRSTELTGEASMGAGQRKSSDENALC